MTSISNIEFERNLFWPIRPEPSEADPREEPLTQNGHRAVPGVTQQMLTAQLRELENDGIVARKIYAQVPPKVEYSLTPLGELLRPLTENLAEWGQHLPFAKRRAESNGPIPNPRSGRNASCCES